MKVVKPVKVPVLSRVVEMARQPVFHVAGLLGFPLASPRALLDELGFWKTVRTVLGENGVVDEGTAKGRAELLVAGSFHAPGGAPCTSGFARAKLGAIDKRVAVLGDRYWRRGEQTAPAPFTEMPIDWAHAFGGPSFARNPAGKGAEPVEHDGVEVHPLPNIEHHGALIRSARERPEPAGLGAFDLSYPQRRAHAGTYDKGWLEQHYPGMPPDADATFFNLAAADQWLAEGSFRGDEEFLVENMSPSAARITGRLPGLALRSFVTQRGRAGEVFFEIPMRCDTVWLMPGAGVGVVVFHGRWRVLEDDAADIVHLLTACEETGARRPLDHYRACLARRLDKDQGAIASLSDRDLMPARESGVAPNFDGGDFGRWLKTESLPVQHGLRGVARQRKRAEDTLKEKGIDISHLPPAPPTPIFAVPDQSDLDAVAEHLVELQKLGEQQLADAKVQKAQLVERARQRLAEQDRDYDAWVDEQQAAAGGPVKLPSYEQVAQLEQVVAQARAAGTPLPTLETALAGGRLKEQLAEHQARADAAYRASAHLTPGKASRGHEEEARLRVIVQAALDSGESLAGRDLTGARLAGMVLAGIDLTGAFLEAADLSGADLRGAKLRNAVLAKATLRGANLSGADLGGANLGAADLRDATLTGANMARAVLGRATLAGTSLCDADLTGADWLEVQFAGVDLGGAKLPQCAFLAVDLRGSSFAGADLSRATFVACQLEGASFAGAMLGKATLVDCRGTGASFAGAKMAQATILSGSALPGANFADADLERACLRTTAFPGACFDRANLAGADLSECDATGASFERAMLGRAMLVRTKLGGASFAGANLMNAMLSKAQIPGADFTGANLFQADLARAVGDDRTRFTEAERGRVRVEPKASPAATGPMPGDPPPESGGVT
ncbi:MAG: DUF2169 domain-containing protein [Myxococcales bacterium]|nr:DUF2169 domain-containing protein [Myxococcales bacterium]